MQVERCRSSCKYVCIYGLCQLRGPGSNDTPRATSIPNTETLVSKTVLQQKAPGRSERRWVLEVRQRTYKLSLESLVVPESKQVLQKNLGVVSKGHKRQLKDLQNWTNLSNKIKQNWIITQSINIYAFIVLQNN